MESSKSTRWFRFLPVIAIAIAGLLAGVYVSSKTGLSSGRVRVESDTTQAATQAATQAKDSTATRAQSDETALLQGIQAKLKSTQVLPSDFKSVPAFSLLDVNGDEITEAALAEQWSLMFFGYTHCPDVCPITLSVMKEVVAKLEADSSPPMQVVFMTVDPVRDTPEIMKNYVGFFSDEFVGISGELNATHEFTRALGIVAAFTANKDDPKNYLVDHTASMLLVDPDLRVRAKFAPPHEAATIVEDYKTLMGAFN